MKKKCEKYNRECNKKICGSEINPDECTSRFIEYKSVEEWISEGERIFGKDKKLWKFTCPSCNTVQSIQELKDLFENNDDDYRNYIAFSCIGRFNNKKKGCDWTLGGFFKIHKACFLDDKENKRPIFLFAENVED